MFKLVCLAIFLGVISTKPSPSKNKQAADYLQAGLIGSAGQKGSGIQGYHGYQAMSRQSLIKAPAQQSAYYRPSVKSGLPTVAACPDVKCHLALTIVLDSSGSVGLEDFTKELIFTRAVIEILTVKAKEVDLKVCIGIVKYSSNAYVTVNPCCGQSMCQVIEKFVNNQIVYSSGSTNTAGALKVARQMLQATSSYKKMVLLITDGRSNVGGSPAGIAKSMRDEDEITILALGVTNSINKPELLSISGEKTVQEIADFEDFEELSELLLESNQMTSDELSSTIDDICANDKPNMENAVSGGWGNWTDGYCRRIYRNKRVPTVGTRRNPEARCVQIKTRQCNNPAPQCGGAACKGKSDIYDSCECSGYGYGYGIGSAVPVQAKVGRPKTMSSHTKSRKKSPKGGRP